MPDHFKYMKTALSLARRGLGQTGANPSVGCVIVKNGVVIGHGRTADGGRPHAEVVALAQVGNSAKGAVMYVTLEPCCHFGKSPPCTEAIIKAGISEVVIANIDPYEEVAGKGVAALEAAGIKVVTGILAAEGEETHAGFFKRIRRNLPYVTLKIASSLDGKTALQNGESKWITGEEARDYGHLLRGQNDAIMTGIGTIIADNPELNCRLPGLQNRSPLRIIIDSDLRIPAESKIITSAKDVPIIIFTKAETKRPELEKPGVTIEKAELSPAGLGIKKILHRLADKGINRLMVESGGKIAASLLKEELVDEICWFQGAKIIGGEGLPAIAALGISQMTDIKKFELLETKKLGEDLLLRLKAKA